jgi:hypothetical protein
VPGSDASAVQAGLFEFAIAELVPHHRTSFPPLWTVESWARLLIWLALNSGSSGDREALERFAAALGPTLTARMRRLFFERELEDAGLRLLADPAEDRALVLPLAPGGAPPEPERVVEPAGWLAHDQLLALPWRQALCA